MDKRLNKVRCRVDKVKELSNNGFYQHCRLIETILILGVTMLGMMVERCQSANLYNNYSIYFAILYIIPQDIPMLCSLIVFILLSGFSYDYIKKVCEYRGNLLENIGFDKYFLVWCHQKHSSVMFVPNTHYVFLLLTII